jgi:uncharacterized membrane protein
VSSEEVGRSRDFERFITFIDAIVAIAITLLVLPLVDVAAELGDGSVAELLRSHLTEIGGFLLSFVVIANAWSSQHHALRSVVASDPVVTRLLLLWTLTIVILPFPTALVAESGHQAATKIFYIGTMTLTSAVLTALCWRIGRNRSIRDADAQPDPAYGLASTVGFLLALAIMLVFPATTYYPLLVQLLVSPLVRVWRERPPSRRHPGR